LWTATDEAGNKANATQIVDVVDTASPIISITSPTNNTSVNTAIVSLSGLASDSGSGVHIVQVRVDSAPFIDATDTTSWSYTTSALSDGFHTITAQVIDNAENTAITKMIVTVDTTAPNITPPAEIKIEATSLNDNTITIDSPKITDIEPVTITNNSTKAFPLGKTVVLWTATDEAGNKANATQIVDVVDTTAPKITPPKNIVVNATSPTSNRVDIGNATTSDDVKVVSVSNDAPAVFPFGNTTVTWAVKDGAGNTASVTQLIQVVDRTPPKLVMPSDIVVNATAFETPITIGQATASGIMDQSPKITNNATSLFHFGKTIIKWTAVDRFGNTNTLAQTITVLACGKSYSDYNLVMGTSGNDILTGSIVSNLIIGLEGDDIIRSGPAGDCIIAGNGDNIIFGGAGNDIIIASNGNNIIKGGTGNAQIYVGNGTNIIEGGSDRDTCYLGEPSKDTVVNCQSKRH